MTTQQVTLNAEVQSQTPEASATLVLPISTIGTVFDTQHSDEITKSGGRKVRLLTGKEWKEQNAEILKGKSNKEKSALYLRYKINAYEHSSAASIEMVAGREWGIHSITENKSGERRTVVFVNRTKIKGANLTEAVSKMESFTTREECELAAAKLQELLKKFEDQ